MKKLLFACAVILMSNVAHADIQRCIGMKPDLKRLTCFDEEAKTAPFTRQALAEQRRVVGRATTGSDMTCHTGPRGGRYRIINGYKRYGC